MWGNGWRARSLGTVAGAALLAGGLAFGAPSAGAATTSFAGVRLNSYESRLVADINSARHSAGLAALAVAGGTTEVARGWAAHLAAADAISHNPDLISELQSHGSANWTFAAENVGFGPASNADDVFQAYMNSPEHRANILATRARYLGVGAVAGPNGAEFNTLDFVDAYTGALAGTGGTSTRKAPTRSRVPYSIGPNSLAHYATAASRGARVTRPYLVRLRSGVAVRFVSAGTTGPTELVQTAALNLAGQSALHLFLSGYGRAGRRVPVALYVLTHRGVVRVGTAWLTVTPRWVNLYLPPVARTIAYRTYVYLPPSYLARAGGWAAVSLGTEKA
jgi:uncharacterized protein YkwD